MSDEFPRFLDIIEYSTNAMIIPQNSHHHPALRDLALAYVVYDDWMNAFAKVQRFFEIQAKY
jgi:hypothetical protein